MQNLIAAGHFRFNGIPLESICAEVHFYFDFAARTRSHHQHHLATHWQVNYPLSHLVHLPINMSCHVTIFIPNFRTFLTLPPTLFEKLLNPVLFNFHPVLNTGTFLQLRIKNWTPILAPPHYLQLDVCQLASRCGSFVFLYLGYSHLSPHLRLP